MITLLETIPKSLYLNKVLRKSQDQEIRCENYNNSPIDEMIVIVLYIHIYIYITLHIL
jgi:hypothetical protein